MDDADNTFVRREDSACNSYDIGGGVKAILVDKAHQMAPALAQLKDSMQVFYQIVDLRWSQRKFSTSDDCSDMVGEK